MRLLINLDAHLPIGTSRRHTAHAVASSFQPLLELLQRERGIRLSLHHSGALIQWVLAEHPAYMVQLAGLVQQGQVSLIGGGFYAPMLAAISRPDALAQLRRTQDFWQDQLHSRPRGARLTEQTWVPHLPELLRQAGLDFALVDARSLRAVGVSETELGQPLASEHLGARIALVAARPALAETLARADTDALLDDLERLRDDGAAQVALDLPTVRLETPLKSGALARLFDQLGTRASWLELDGMPLQQPDSKPLIAYPSSATVGLQGTYSMAPESGLQRHKILAATAAKGSADRSHFIHGATWSGYLSRYPEAQALHQKTQWLSRTVAAARIPTSWRVELEHRVQRAQAHDAYGHGPNAAGIYRPALRRAVLAEHQQIEETLRSLAACAAGEPKRLNGLEVQAIDFDGDGVDDLCLIGSRAQWTISPAQGATISGCAVPASGLDLIDLVARKPEFYHRMARHGQGGYSLSSPDVAEHIGQTDEQPLFAFTDRFITAEEQVALSQTDLSPLERGDFIGATFTRISPPADDPEGGFRLGRAGTIRGIGGGQVYLEKHFILSNAGRQLEVRYTIANRGAATIANTFVPELYFSLPAESPSDLRMKLGDAVYAMDQSASHRGASVQMIAPHHGVQISVIVPAVLDLGSDPIFAVHQDGDSVRATYQGHRIRVGVPLRLASGTSWTGTFVLRIAHHPVEEL
jgi:hypothetical protein